MYLVQCDWLWNVYYNFSRHIIVHNVPAIFLHYFPLPIDLSLDLTRDLRDFPIIFENIFLIFIIKFPFISDIISVCKIDISIH